MLEFLLQMFGSSAIEMIAVACGLINVMLIIQRSLWNYPFGFIMVALYAKIFYDYQLYSEALLQIYFFLIQIYGLWYWLRGKTADGAIIVVTLPPTQRRLYLLVTLLGWLGLSSLMAYLTDATHPYWDAAIATLSVMAQFLLSRRHIESWTLWIIVDVLAIGLYWIKGLSPTAALYLVFLSLAIVGRYRWQHTLTQQRQQIT